MDLSLFQAKTSKFEMKQCAIKDSSSPLPTSKYMISTKSSKNSFQLHQEWIGITSRWKTVWWQRSPRATKQMQVLSIWLKFWTSLTRTMRSSKSSRQRFRANSKTITIGSQPFTSYSSKETRNWTNLLTTMKRSTSFGLKKKRETSITKNWKGSLGMKGNMSRL